MNSPTNFSSVVPLFIIMNVVSGGLVFGGCHKQGSEVHAIVSAQEQSRTIRVNGIASLEVNPDVVDLTLTLSVTREQPKAAMTSLRKKQQPLVAALVEAGVSKPELRLSLINVSPH